jgi:hypothetical protein
VTCLDAGGASIEQAASKIERNMLERGAASFMITSDSEHQNTNALDYPAVREFLSNEGRRVLKLPLNNFVLSFENTYVG